jgi:hypothetical protein
MLPITRNARPKVQAAAATIRNLDKRSLNMMIDNALPFQLPFKTSIGLAAGNKGLLFPAGIVRRVVDRSSAPSI